MESILPLNPQVLRLFCFVIDLKIIVFNPEKLLSEQVVFSCTMYECVVLIEPSVASHILIAFLFFSG